jgi:hypothetical protein
MSNDNRVHRFTRSEVNECVEKLTQAIKKYFGEVHSPKSDGEYRGVSWECRSMIGVDSGIWRLCQAAVHKDAKRVFGKIEQREAGHLLIFILFYEPVEVDERRIIIHER